MDVGFVVKKRFVHLDTHWPSCQFYSWLGRWCTWDYIIWRDRESIRELNSGLFCLQNMNFNWKRQRNKLFGLCIMFVFQHLSAWSHIPYDVQKIYLDKIKQQIFWSILADMFRFCQAHPHTHQNETRFYP